MSAFPRQPLHTRLVQQSEDREADDIPIDVYYGWLFVGSKRASQNQDAIEKLKITHIFSLIGPAEHPIPHITYGHVKIRDEPSQSLGDALVQFLGFVQLALLPLNNNVRLLVHCHAGISRSVSMLIAYLMIRYRYKYDEALAQICKTRPEANPNPGFERQLRSIEERINR